MNKKNNRKGFTTVELVIVIAVIAILATALIPTFGGLIDSANQTKYMSEAKQAFNDYMLKNPASASDDTYYIETAGGYYKVTAGKLGTKPVDADENTKGIQNPTLTCKDNVLKNNELTPAVAHEWEEVAATQTAPKHWDCKNCDATSATDPAAH